MLLLESLAHMPYIQGDDVFCCVSAGSQTFSSQSTDFDRLHRIIPVVTHYQPWNLARLNNGVVYPIRHRLPMNNPFQMFCNPVVNGGEISFVYNRCLYGGVLVDDTLIEYRIVATKVFSGFSISERTALVYSPCKPDSPQIVLNGNDMVTALDYVLRIVPSGDGHIITGQKDNALISVLLTNNGAYRLQVDGNDVYKCCLTQGILGDVIHAKREGGFEQRFLHRDKVTTIDFPNFVR